MLCARQLEGYPHCIEQCGRCGEEELKPLAIAMQLVLPFIIAAVVITVGQMLGFIN